LPLIQWTTVRLVVSKNEGRRHDSEMEPQGRGSVSPLHTRRPNRTPADLRKTTLRWRVHVQTVRLNAEKIISAPSRRGDISLDIPFYRALPVTASDKAFIGTWDRAARTFCEYSWSCVTLVVRCLGLAVPSRFASGIGPPWPNVVHSRVQWRVAAIRDSITQVRRAMVRLRPRSRYIDSLTSADRVCSNLERLRW
jgi:hypothetical protein